MAAVAVYGGYPGRKRIIYCRNVETLPMYHLVQGKHATSLQILSGALLSLVSSLIKKSCNLPMSVQDPGAAITSMIVNYLPLVIGAIITFLIGWAIALIVSKIITIVLRAIHLDSFFERIGIKLGGKESKFDVAGFIGWLIMWYIIFITLIATFNALQLPQIAGYIAIITNYIPNIIGAAAIIILGVVIADALARIIGGIAGVSRVVSPKLLSAIVKWTVLIFVGFAALVELNIAPVIIEILFAGLVTTTVLFLGLAFGLGGKDWARGILDKASSAASRAASKMQKEK